MREGPHVRGPAADERPADHRLRDSTAARSSASSTRPRSTSRAQASTPPTTAPEARPRDEGRGRRARPRATGSRASPSRQLEIRLQDGLEVRLQERVEGRGAFVGLAPSGALWDKSPSMRGLSPHERRDRAVPHRDPRRPARRPARPPRRTRWPERETVDDWSQGIPLGYVQELCRYWADGLRLAGDRGAAQRAPAVPDRARRARHPLPPRPLARTPTPSRSSSPTAGRDRSSSS